MNTKLEELASLIDEGENIGIDLALLKKKFNECIRNVNTDKIRIVLLGAFSDGKTSVIAGLLGKTTDDMKIDVAESSNEISVYKLEGLDKSFEIVDTPGLFGFKEEEFNGSVQKLSQKTQDYISQAHCVIYVTGAVNPVKASHADALRLVLRTYGKLSTAIFVINKMDEAYDVEDDADFDRGKKIKTESFRERMTSVLELNSKEAKALNVVCIAANPGGCGLDYWQTPENKEAYEACSHIRELEAQILRFAGNANKGELRDDAISAVLAEYICKVYRICELMSDGVKKMSSKFHDEYNRQKEELAELNTHLSETRSTAHQRLLDLQEPIIMDIDGATTLSGLNAVVERDFGKNDKGEVGYLLLDKINNIFADAESSNKASFDTACDFMQTSFEAQDKVLQNGLKFMSNGMKGVKINGATVLNMRNMFATSVKFKPWGAVNLAAKLTKVIKIGGTVLAVLGEAFLWYRKYKEQKKLKEGQEKLKGSLASTFASVLSKCANDKDYIDNFAPGYNDMELAVEERKEQFSKLEQQGESLRNYKDKLLAWYGKPIEDVVM